MKHYGYRPLKTVVLCTSLFALVSSSGCISLLPEAAPAPTIYRLSSGQKALDKSSAQPIILITLPQTSKALSGDDIVLSPDGIRLAYAADSRWAEPVPSLLQHAIFDAIGNAKSVTGVLPASGARPQYTLAVGVKSYEAVFINGEDEAPEARVELTVTLTNSASRTLAGMTTLSASQRASERRVSKIVEAQDAATRQVMTQLAAWIEQTISGPSVTAASTTSP